MRHTAACKAALQGRLIKALTLRNWLIGYYIVEYEQNGSDRAEYGAKLLNEIAKSLKTKGLKGLDVRSLRDCRTFYTFYPQIRGSLTPEFRLAGKAEIRGATTPELQMQQLATTESAEAYPIPNEVLLSRLSYTHFVELMRAKEPLERLFYEVEAIKNNWSVKDLGRAFDSALYVRTGLYMDKELEKYFAL